MSREELRKIGVEIEYPVVGKEGMAFPVSQIFPGLVEEGWQPEFDDIYGEEIVAVSKEGRVITVDAGEGILEINEPPFDSLQKAGASLRRTLNFLAVRLEPFGAKILGYGAQPFENRNNWSHKGRYDFLRSIFSSDLGKITRTAASQVHVDIKPEEIYRAINVLNAASGVAIALCANSPIMHGDESEKLAKREMVWDSFAPLRSGVVPRWFRSNEDLFSFCGLLPLLITKINGSYFAPGVPYSSYVKDLSEEEKGVHSFYHEGTLWFSARYRKKYGTVEFRPCCTQPHNEAMVVAAFALGLIESLEEAHNYFKRLYYNGPVSFSCLRKSAVWNGLDGIDPGVLRDTLFLVFQGLKKRKHGEEVFAEPLLERLRTAFIPAKRATGSLSVVKEFAL